MTRVVPLVVIVITMMLLVTQARGQSVRPPIMDPTNRGHIDLPAIPIAQAADVIVVLIPDETFDLHVPTAHERVVRGSVARLEKGPLPQRIVHTPNTIVTGLQAGVPTKVFLKKFKDREDYYIIGVFAEPSKDEKP
jgi:hypothetical protein